MPAYTVSLSPPGTHAIPPLLQRFGEWLSKQEHGSLGWFELEVEAVPIEWQPDVVPRINRDGFSFLQTPDDSLLVLLTVAPGQPAAVVLLGSEGETDTVAGSLEEFLALLSRGETSVMDLDEEDAAGRSKLRSWLSRNKVTAPAAQPFDFDAYLDGTPATVPTPTAPISAPLPDLPPQFGKLVSLIGRRADDPELSDFVTNTLGQKVPGSMTDTGSSKNVSAKKHGLEMVFNHDIKNEKYPLLPKSKSSYVPYLTLAWLNKKWSEPLPFGLEFDLSAEELTARLGEPNSGGADKVKFPAWTRLLDPVRDIQLRAEVRSITVGVIQALELFSRHDKRPGVGLFVAWALSHDLLDESAFPGHAELLAALRRHERQGSDLIKAALPRGLWDLHLKPLPGLRDFVFCWFRNIGDFFIEKDLIGVFGSRKGSHGLPEPILDDDTWPAVKKATRALDKRFAEWV
jgi:hypothetical protein